MRLMNILIAEDDDQNQAMMKLMLVRQGHTVQSAWTGRAAVDAVKTGKFDLVFMDVQMPEVDGLEATRQIRQWENNKQHIPIVILTGSVPEKIKEDYKNAGADTFILKPFDVKRIAMLVEIFAEEQDASVPVESRLGAEDLTSDLPLLDMPDSLPRFNNDKKFYLENLQEFIQSLPGRLACMDQYLDSRNWHDLANNAHNLKGVAANFGAKRLSLMASRLDDYSDQHQFEQVQFTLKEIHNHISIITEAAGKLITGKTSHESDRLGGQ